jgi:hypothetical protein
MEIGNHVVYVDEYGKGHNALVTEVWGGGDTPSLNVVYVETDDSKTDQYGRQLHRATSAVHKSNQGAHGRYWFED